MIEAIYTWMKNIVFFLVIITAVLEVLPGTAYQKYIRFFTGLVLVFMMAAPVLKILGTDGQVMNFYKSREYEKTLASLPDLW